jgi:hypothetical protein
MQTVSADLLCIYRNVVSVRGVILFAESKGCCVIVKIELTKIRSELADPAKEDPSSEFSFTPQSGAVFAVFTVDTAETLVTLLSRR